MNTQVSTKIADLKNNDLVQGCYLVAHKALLWTREGKPYLKLGLMDTTGRMEAILWEDAELQAPHIAQGDVVAIKGMVGEYQKERRIKITYIETVPDGEVRKEDFMPSSPRPIEEMHKELTSAIRKVKDPYLKQLLNSVFHDASVWERFSKAPAGKSLHHAYLGGLLEHTLSVVRLCESALPNYPFLDTDLVIAGALLHDVGKAWELSFETGFDYTDQGQLLGHIVLGVRLIEEKISKIPDFPKERAMLITHLVISHHGETEFGSPKQPMTLEAIFLNKLDDLDAKLWGVFSFLEKEGGNKTGWSPYHKVHERYFYLPEHLVQAIDQRRLADKDKEESENGAEPDLFDR